MVESNAVGKSMLKWTAAIAVGSLLAGCGGGGGLSLSGGSIPTGGGGTITGNLALPSGQPLTSATTTVGVLDPTVASGIAANSQRHSNASSGYSTPSASSNDVSVTIDNSGNFTVSGVPESKDLELQFTNGTVTLLVVIPASAVTSSTPVNIGAVNAATTVVAQAVNTDIANNVDTAANIISTQLANFNANQAIAGETQQQQQNDVTNPNARKSSAFKLMVKTADTEIRDVTHSPSNTTGLAVVDGMLAYISAQGGAIETLTSTERQQLITLSMAGHVYTDTQVAAALTAAGVPTTASAVDQADTTQRSTLHSLASIQGIPTAEAMAIAGCPSSAGGFGLVPTQFTTFIDALIAG
jgi:hypothetical protein